MQRKILLSVAVALVLGAPAATASWKVGGSLEPDTTWDTMGGYMFPNPDTSSNPDVAQVYFNAVQHTFVTFVNPNTGATGSSVRATPHQTYAAYLGVWKDCNKDGYIGHVENVFAEYPSALLDTQDVCPAGSEHNSDGYVYEFFPVGPGDLDASTADAEADAGYQPAHLVNDTGALVWGDRGFPGQQPRGSCAINPLPAGTTGSSGGAIGYADCVLARRLATTTQDVDPDGSLGIRVDSTPQDDESVLNQRYPVHPWYDPWNDDTGALEDTSANNREKDPAFVAWDCSAPATPVADPTGGEIPSDVDDPTGGEISDDGKLVTGIVDEDGNLFYVPALATDPSPNPEGSFYDGANQTWATCDEDASLGLGTEGVVEDNHGGVDTEAGRRETDVYFSFTYPSYVVLLTDHESADDNVCVLTEVPVAGDVPPGCRDIQPANGTIPEDMPYWGGIGVHRTDAFAGGPIWYGLPNYVTAPQSVNRQSLQPEGADFWTFYAHVGLQTQSAYDIPVGRGVYGSHACGESTSGLAAGWDCDPTHWWNPSFDAGASAMPTQATNSDDTCDGAGGAVVENCRNVGVKVHQPYELRDVDCYDGQLARGVPAYASLVVLADACERPA